MDLTTKNVLNFEEAVEYTGMKASYLYKLTSAGKICHYKPFGKMIYFRREELEEFLTRKADKKQSKAK
jgi:excisionase family DNA binding protein